jgi:hypothetical protein
MLTKFKLSLQCFFSTSKYLSRFRNYSNFLFIWESRRLILTCSKHFGNAQGVKESAKSLALVSNSHWELIPAVILLDWYRGVQSCYLCLRIAD